MQTLFQLSGLLRKRFFNSAAFEVSTQTFDPQVDHFRGFHANLPFVCFLGFHANLSALSQPLSGFLSKHSFLPPLVSIQNLLSSTLPLFGFPRKPFFKPTAFFVSTQTFPPQAYHFRGFHANLSSSLPETFACAPRGSLLRTQRFTPHVRPFWVQLATRMARKSASSLPFMCFQHDWLTRTRWSRS
jgi:hypothetical protein